MVLSRPLVGIKYVKLQKKRDGIIQTTSIKLHPKVMVLLPLSWLNAIKTAWLFDE